MVAQRKCIFLTCIGIVLLIGIIIAVVFATKKKSITPKKTGIKAEHYKKAAVATDAEVCSKIGAEILRENGSAIDAAIAAMFCTGVANPHSCGIGGGSFLVYYNRADKKVSIYDFRETAPSFASETMYVNNRSHHSKYGGLASGIPGQVKGLWALHKKHGKLPWAKLVGPSVRLAKNGFIVTTPVDHAIKRVKDKKYLSPGLKKLITKSDGTFLTKGDTLKNPELAKTLETIITNTTSFYDGDLAKLIVQDIRNANGNISLDDLKRYQVKNRTVVTLNLTDSSTLNTIGAPGSGAILAMIYNIMSGYKFSKGDLSNLDDAVDFYQKLVESMKFSYAQRGFLGDPDFVANFTDIARVYNIATNSSVGQSIRDKISLNTTHNVSYYGGAWGKDDFGTSHISILAENGDAVSCTSTINYLFGSLVRSEKTGIIYNNQMDDFSTPGKPNLYGYPPAPANFIRPGKRPLSSMSPTIVINKNGDVKMVAGASGGSRIISGTSQVIIKTLLLGAELGEAVTSYRLHHQGIPNKLQYNTKYPPKDMRLLKRLKAIGHKIEGLASDSVVQAIYKDGRGIYAKSDPRKHSKSDGY